MAQRKVLLAVRTGHIDRRLLASAKGLCKRLDADLEILLLTTDDRLPGEVEVFIKTLLDEGVAYGLTKRSLLRRRDVVEYANSHECIATVVIDSLEGWQSVAEDRSSNPWAKLSCPLVTAAAKPTESHRSP